VFLAGEARAYPAHLVARWHRKISSALGVSHQPMEICGLSVPMGRPRILTGPDNEGAGSNIQLLRFSSFSPLLLLPASVILSLGHSQVGPLLCRPASPGIPQFIANNNPLIFEQQFRIVAAFGVGVSQCQLYLSSSSSHKLVNRPRNQSRQNEHRLLPSPHPRPPPKVSVWVAVDAMIR
jgi:hypothetical protein